MARFSYTIQNAKGETSSGTLEAGDENEAIASLQGRGHFILSIREEREAGRVRLWPASSRVGARELAFFGEQLATLLSGGVPLVRALSLLGGHTHNAAMKRSLQAVTQEVAGGSALHKAMEKQPRVFDPMWTSLIQAGELSGQLPKTLRQLSSYLQAQADMKAKVVTALAYPAILLCFSLVVLFFFILKIVPTFAEIFKSFDLKLPWITQLVIGVSNFLANNFLLGILGLLGVGLLAKGYAATEAGQFAKAKLLFDLPFFGSFAKNIYVERLLSTLATLIESGVSILTALSVLEGVFSGNSVFRRTLATVKTDVAAGKSISGSFKASGVFPPLMTEMMWMGEESGKLPDILGTLSAFYREQIDQFTRRFTSVIDPIMVIFIGGIVGLIVLSVFMPIFQLSQIGMRGG